MVLLTEGFSSPFLAKTAICLLKYRGDEVLAVLDRELVGQSCSQVLGAGGDTPFVASLAEVDRPDALVIGIAPPGGRLPDPWREHIAGALEKGIDIVSGLHQFLCEDDQFRTLAAQHGVRLIDVRRNNEKETAKGNTFRPECLRIHTVGNDCSVGKMVASLEIQRRLVERGFDAGFAATGQTGIMVAGSGTPIDCVVADFISGATERLVERNQHHDFLLIEGQGSITHPAFSGVTLGLLHGCAPDGMILCYEVGRENVKSLDHIPLTSLPKTRDLLESIASARHPCRVIGVAMNSRRINQEQAEEEKRKVQAEMGLPVCDVYRDGADVLVDAVLRLREELDK